MKDSIQTIRTKSSFRNLFTFFLLTSVYNLYAQPPFENHFGVNSSGNDGLSLEFVTCPSIDANYTYVGVQSFQSSGQMKIRGVRVTSTGTMFASSFDFIAATTSTLDLFPLKIIPFIDQNGQDGYLITGYVKDQNNPLPKPFVIQADNNLNATTFKIFTDHFGFFTDVDQLTNGDLIFCGSTTSTLTIATPTRLGWIMRTDNVNFTAQWMRYTHLYEHLSSKSQQDFDAVQDLILLDDDSALVCGNVSEHVDCEPAIPGLDSTRSRVFVAKVNLNNGAFVWQKCRFIKNFAARLAINNAGTIVALATNGEFGSSTPAIIYMDRSGNITSAKHFEPSGGKYVGELLLINGVPNLDTKILAHIPFVQNIYFKNNDNDLFISGKFVKTLVESDPNMPPSIILGTFEMPFSTSFDGTNFGFTHLYKSAQVFTPFNFLSYNSFGSTACGEKYPTFVSSSNTLPCLSNCGTDEFITITVDVGSVLGNIGQDKVWIFSNENTSICGYTHNTTDNANCQDFDHVNISNDDIEVVPEVADEDFTNSDPSRILHNCEQ